MSRCYVDSAAVIEEADTVGVAEVMARILPTSTDIDADAAQMMERIVKDFASAISSIAVSLLASNVSNQHLGNHIISAANQMGFRDYGDPLTAYDSYISLHGNNNNNNKKRLNNRNDASILEDKRAKLNSSYIYSRQVAKDKDKDKDKDTGAKLAVGSSSSSRPNASFIPPAVTATATTVQTQTQKTSSTGTAIASSYTAVSSRSNTRDYSSEVKQRIVQDYLTWDPRVKYNATIMAKRHDVTPAIVRRSIEHIK